VRESAFVCVCVCVCVCLCVCVFVPAGEYVCFCAFVYIDVYSQRMMCAWCVRGSGRRGQGESG